MYWGVHTFHIWRTEDSFQELGLFLQHGSQNPIKIARPGGKCPYSLSLLLSLGLANVFYLLKYLLELVRNI